MDIVEVRMDPCCDDEPTIEGAWLLVSESSKVLLVLGRFGGRGGIAPNDRLVRVFKLTTFSTYDATRSEYTFVFLLCSSVLVYILYLVLPVVPVKHGLYLQNKLNISIIRPPCLLPYW